MLVAVFVLSLALMGAMVAIVAGGGKGPPQAVVTTATPTTQTKSASSTSTTAVAATFTLSVFGVGDGRGTISFRGSTRSCLGDPCLFELPFDEQVTLIAKPDAGSRFGGWSSPCRRTATCTLKMARDEAVTATFSLEATGNCEDGVDNDADTFLDDEDPQCLLDDSEEPADGTTPPVGPVQPPPILPPPPPPLQTPPVAPPPAVPPPPPPPAASATSAASAASATPAADRLTAAAPRGEDATRTVTQYRCAHECHCRRIHRL